MPIRFTWPWGRLAPSKRLQEIDRLIARHQATMRIIEAQAREAMRLHQKTIQALQDQRAIVEAFLDEDRRRSVMDRAYALEVAGIPVLDRIALADTPDDIETLLSEAEQEAALLPLRTPPIGNNIASNEPENATEDNDLFAEGLDDSNDPLFIDKGE